ncbi:transglutaminase-like domain-containing protein [Micropruina sp.]|uniref:transglutaminase-like domain-containing protein n=1 Tax=Micropruina sp. TaxID=2737536 RepID=UPI0039E4CAFA
MPAVRTLRIGCEFNHVAQLATPAAFLIRPSAETRIVRELWTTDPVIETARYHDVYGNEICRLMLPPGESLVSHYAVVEVPDEVDPADFSAPARPVQELPDEVLIYTLPSRYCQSDLLATDAWRLFGTQQPSYELVAHMQDWVWNHLEYRSGSTGSLWTAKDSFDNGFGVCRDFAHLLVTLCRAISIPARYCSGYLPDMDVPPLPTAMDFHAWVEVYLGDRWWTFDPRHNARRKGHVTIGRGRDAADLAMVTTWGMPWLRRLTVWADEDLTEPWPPLEVSMAARDPFGN